MVKTILASSLGAAALLGQSLTFKNVTTTETQAVIRYSAPNKSACTVQISESSTLSPLVHDVDPALFPGSNLDSRLGQSPISNDRVFVAGKRDAETASDGKRYSRALQAFTQHYYAVTCGASTVSGTFRTADPPLGNEYPDTLPFNPSAFGNYGWPSIDWVNQDTSYVDPLTGLLLKRASYPGFESGVGSGSPAAVQDGADFYTSGNSCAGSKWTNPCAALASDGVFAVYNGAGGDALSVLLPKGAYLGGASMPQMGSLTNFQVQALGFGTDASAANRTVNVCLSAHVYTGACGTGSFPIVLPQTTAGTVAYPATLTPDQLLPGWTTSSFPAPISMLDATPRTFTVTVNGSTVTWTGSPAYSPNVFSENWIAGDHITIPGSSPACPSNDCAIASVQSAYSLTIQQNLGNFNSGNAVTATADNFGVIISKTTGTGSVSIDSVSDQQEGDMGITNPSYGGGYSFSSTTLPVCVDRNGNPISPCRNAYGMVLPGANGNNGWYLFFPDNGETRFIDALTPPNVSGTDGYSNPYCQNAGAQFGYNNPATVFCSGVDSTGKNAAIVQGAYNFNSTNGCDYRHYNGYLTSGNNGENPCIIWTNVTPISTGNGLTKKIQAFWPSYDPSYDGGGSYCGTSRDGRYMYLRLEQGAAPGSNPQDIFGAGIVYDLVNGAVTQRYDTYSTYPARFGQMHGCPSEYFPGYNSEYIGTFDWQGGPRGTADYQLIVNSISGRSDLSLDPASLYTVTNITQVSPPVITTAVPHQIATGNSAGVIFAANTDTIYGGMYYCKPLTSTTCALYNDAAYSNPAQTPSYMFQQGMTGPWVIGNLVGGTGCTGTSFSAGPISDENGTGATITANIGGGSVTSVTVTAAGSGYTAPVYVPLTGNSCSGASVVLNPQGQYMQTTFTQACPTVAAKWQAMGVTPGALNCITLNLAADPVKIYNTDQILGGTSGVHNVNILNEGSGYTSMPTVTISGGGGTGATVTATVSGGAITGITMNANGSGYSYPRVAFSNPAPGCSVCIVAHGSVTTSGGAVTGVNLSGAGLYEPPGGWYVAAPTVTFYGPGTGASGTVALGTSGELSDINVVAGGTGYQEQPVVTISGGGGTGATATAQVNNGSVTGFKIANRGSGYTSAPTVTISGGYGSGATATAVVAWPVASVTISSGGSGYNPPVVTVSGGGGTGAALTAGLYEEMTAFPYPHNATNCGGDGTTTHCWTQPLTLQEGDAFNFIGESQDQERPFAVQVTHNGDGTVTAVFARFVGAYYNQVPLPAAGAQSTTSDSYYTHHVPILPTMTPSNCGYGCAVIFALTDTTGANGINESPQVNMHGDSMIPANPAYPTALLGNDGFALHVRIGGASVIGQNFQYATPDPTAFNGSTAQMNRGMIQTHLSTRQYAAPPNELGWYLDARPLSNESAGVSNVFQNTVTQVGTCSGSICIYQVSSPYGVDVKNMPMAAWAGDHLLMDKSGPGSVLSVPGDVWKYCIAYNAGECVSGSTANSVYMVVNAAVTNGQCGAYYGVNAPCIVPPMPDFSYNVQQGYTMPSLEGADWRRLSMGFTGWARNNDGFLNTRATPDGSWAIVYSHWLEGLAPVAMAVKLPPWPDGVPANLAQYVQIPVPVEPRPGMVKAKVRFGYAENGAPGSFFCTTRLEACTTSGTPFAFASETQQDTPCAGGCVINIPAVPRRVVYYEVDWLNSSGSVIWQTTSVDVADVQIQLLRRKELAARKRK